MNGSEKQSPPPHAGRGRVADPSASLLPTSAPKAFDEDNPFLRRLEFILSKSSRSQATTTAADVAPRTDAGHAARGREAQHGLADFEAGVRSFRLGSTPPVAGTSSAAGKSESWPSAAQPKTTSDRVGKVMPPPFKPQPPQPPRIPTHMFEINYWESSDEDNDGTFRDSRVSAAPPYIAEAKSGRDCGAGGARDPRSEEECDRVTLPRPSSDGGWPETKRCPPPNLVREHRKEEEVEATGRGKRGGGRGAPPSSRTCATVLGRADTTGGRTYIGGGLTGARGIDCDRPSSQVMRNDGSGFDMEAFDTEAVAAISAPNYGTSVCCGEDDDWMSDAEEKGPLFTPPAFQNGKPEARAGHKRGRSTPIRSPVGYGSDGGSNSSDGDGRGRKKGRSEHCSTPALRRPRSSSLSLTPPRLAAFDSDFDSDEDASDGKLTARRGSAAKRKGQEKRVKGSRLSRPRVSSVGGAATGARSDRGRKRGHEELLNDRIEAMRVGSDGEGSVNGSVSGCGGRRGGGGCGRVRIEPVDSDQLMGEGRRLPRCRRGGGGKSGSAFDDLRREGRQIQDQDEKDRDDGMDAADLKPSIENPTWLGPLEAFDLCGGGFINPSINRYLKGYQREGVKWLYTKYVAGEGAVLGDDMGLGKTVQSIALVSAVLRKTGTVRDKEELKRRRRQGLPASTTGLPWLIVAPASVARVWMEHLETWGYFSTYHLESGKEIDDLMASLGAGRLEIVVTSYDLLRMHKDRLKRIRFDAVLFDEYHTLKSSSSMVSQAALELDRKRVFGLTGTIIQNDMKELWFLTHLIDPTAVGEQARFAEHFSEPIKRARAMNATAADRRLGDKRLRELNALRSKNMIRRTKEEVLSDVLKGKSDTVVFCDLSEVQRDLYLRTLALPEFQLLKRANEPCDCGRKGAPRRASCCHKIPLDESGDGIDPRAVLFRKFHPTGEECAKCPFCCQLAAVSKLQKIANHPCLLQENLRDSMEKRRHQRMFAEMVFTEKTKEAMGGLDRSQNFLMASRVGTCGKMASLEVLLESFYRSRDKVLVFSWSTAMLDVLESLVTSKGYNYRRLDGATPPKERQTRVKEFNTDRHGVFVFLISTRAGGQGLNLHSASRVVLYDVNWNPANESQAQDRAYRIGQKNKVAVFRLISKGTIEEVCYMRQIYKLQITSAAMGDQARGGRRQFTAVQGSKGQEGELFGIQNLLKFSDDSLLKTLRAKYAASTAAAAAAAAAGAGDKSIADGTPGAELAVEADVADSSIKNRRKECGHKLGGSKVDTVDEVELISAMQEAVGQAKEEMKDDRQERPEDAELAGLLGVLGMDAYTHDQLVAKDEGEEELPEEASASEIEPPPLPFGGRRNAFECTIMTPPGLTNHQGRSVPEIFKGLGGSAIDRSRRVPRAPPGAMSPLKLQRVRDFSAKAAVAKVVNVDGREDALVGAVVECGRTPPPPPTPTPSQPQDSAKKRRNLDWGKGKQKAKGIQPAVADRAGAVDGAVVGGFKLFLPAYGTRGQGGGGGGGGAR